MERNRRKREQLKLDQIMRVLFKLSQPLIVDLLNHLFHERFAADEVTLSYSDGQFILDDFERIIGDLYITVRMQEHVYTYHIEFQTLNDQSMVIRMFRYGFEKALEQIPLETYGKQTPSVIEFPKQLVIFLEENENIGDELSLFLRLPDGQEIEYKVPVMKYWTYSAKDLKEQRMYALLPLQVFKSRKRLMAIYNSRKPEIQKVQLLEEEFQQLKANIFTTMQTIRELTESSLIRIGDLDRILKVLHNITEYLYNKYDQYEPISQEVNRMIKTFIDPKVRREGKIEGKIEVIVELLQELGPISNGLMDTIERQSDMQTLGRWVKLAARASSVEDFAAKIKG